MNFTNQDWSSSRVACDRPEGKRSSPLPPIVTLSEAKGLARWAHSCFAALIRRCAQDDRAVPSCHALARRERSPDCHPERSEGSGSLDREILRFAQDDRAGAFGFP